MNSKLQEHFVTHTCSREQLIKDGLLVDITEAAQKAEIPLPVAMTKAAWIECVAWKKRTSTRKQRQRNENTRLWQLVWTCRCAFLGGVGIRLHDAFVLFQIDHYPDDVGANDSVKKTLKAFIAPSDRGERVITISLLHED